MVSGIDSDQIFSTTIQNNYYDNFVKVAQTSYYTVYAARSSKTNQACTIRMLDPQSEFVLKDHDAALTLFIQEIFHLLTRVGGSEQIIIQDFEIIGNRAALVTSPYYSLQKKIENPKEFDTKRVDIEKMLKEVASDIHFIYNRLNIPNLQVTLNNIFYMQDTDAFFLGDWQGQQHLSTSKKEPTSEVYSLGLSLLELTGVKSIDIKRLSYESENCEGLLDDIIGNLQSRFRA